MSNDHLHRWDESPTIEVRVFRHGVLVHQELCESEELASLVVDEWSELDGVQCEVDDLTIRHLPGDIFEPEPVVTGDDDVAQPSAGDAGAAR
jgi:hypothetical protein